MIDEKTIIEYLRASTADVFSSMLGMDVSGKQEHSDQNTPAVPESVLAFVGIAGSWAGTGVISCSAEFACRLSNRLLMADFSSVDGEVLDAVGEVANMVIGNFKTMVEERVGPLGLSIPTVIYGRKFASRSLAAGDWIVLPFRCEDEVMTIRCCLAPAKDPAAPRHGWLANADSVSR